MEAPGHLSFRSVSVYITHAAWFALATPGGNIQRAASAANEHVFSHRDADSEAFFSGRKGSCTFATLPSLLHFVFFVLVCIPAPPTPPGAPSPLRMARSNRIPTTPIERGWPYLERILVQKIDPLSSRLRVVDILFPLTYYSL